MSDSLTLTPGTMPSEWAQPPKADFSNLEPTQKHTRHRRIRCDGVDGKLRFIRPGPTPIGWAALTGLVVQDDQSPIFETVHAIGADTHVDAAHCHAPVFFLFEHRERPPFHFKEQPLPNDTLEVAPVRWPQIEAFGERGDV